MSRLIRFLQIGLLSLVAPLANAAKDRVYSDCFAVFRDQITTPEEEFDLSVARSWHEALKGTAFSKTGTVVEFAPGNRMKVGLALAASGFKGTLYVVEPSKPMLEALLQKYKTILPNAKVIALPIDLTSALNQIPGPIDLLLANHAVDDMILNHLQNLHPQTDSKQNVFNTNQYYKADTFSSVEKLWRAGEADPKLMNTAAKKTTEDLLRAINYLNPKNTILAEYESYYFKSRKFHTPFLEAQKVVQEIRAQLSENSITVKKPRPHWGADQDQSFWLMMNNKTSYPKLRSSSRPLSLDRVSPTLVVPQALKRIKANDDDVLFISKEIGWETSYVTENFALEVSDQSIRAPGTIVGFVDKQADPLGMALSDNLGSGRAAYVGQYNIKGVGPTVLMTSKHMAHSNGLLSTRNALWEAFTSTVLATNLKTGAAAGRAVIDRNLHITKPRAKDTDPKMNTALEIRDGGEGLVRPSHIFQAQKAMTRSEMLTMSQAFGKQDAEKFIERIGHGAWSAGNISISGHMVDFDTVTAVITRAPTYNFTGNYIGNVFGYEFEGQFELLESMLKQSSINIGKVTPAEARAAMLQARSEQISRRFPNLMGFENAPSVSTEFIEHFQKVSRYMGPDYLGMTQWTRARASVGLFDWSALFRSYPLIESETPLTRQIVLDLIKRKGQTSESPYVSKTVREYLKKEGILVTSADELRLAEEDAWKFAQEYERLFKTMSGNKKDPSIAVNAYRINENRKYFDPNYGNRVLDQLIQRKENKELSGAQVRQFMNALVDASDRRIGKNMSEYKTDFGLYENGYSNLRVSSLDAQIRFQVTLIKVPSEADFTQKFTLTVGGEQLDAQARKLSTGEWLIETKSTGELSRWQKKNLSIQLSQNGREIPLKFLVED
jgi:hypothetical protein